jgi:hypothetical protein
VLSASLGYNGEVYMQGKYIELESEKEVEELVSFGCVIVDPIVKAKEIEVKVEEPKVEPKSVSEGRIGNHSGGRKRK